MTIDKTKLAPVTKLVGEDAEETRELEALVAKAKEFIMTFDWNADIREIFSGIAVPGVVGVFLVWIVPRSANVDDELWVVVGDVPPAYLVTDDAPTPASALALYTDLMSEWVAAVRSGQSVSDLIPVDAEPTRENAEMLASRLRFLVERVLPEYSGSR
jgi:hypothetical protein